MKLKPIVIGVVVFATGAALGAVGTYGALLLGSGPKKVTPR